jgi:hypothetical protein
MTRALQHVSQHQFTRVRIEVHLPADVGVRVAPKVVLQQGDRDYQRHQAAPVIINDAGQVGAVDIVDLWRV